MGEQKTQQADAREQKLKQQVGGGAEQSQANQDEDRFDADDANNSHDNHQVDQGGHVACACFEVRELHV